MKISDLSSHDSLILLKGKTFLLQQHPLSMFLPLLLQVYSHKFHTIRNFPKINEFSRSENNISKYSPLSLSLSFSLHRYRTSIDVQRNKRVRVSGNGALLALRWSRSDVMFETILYFFSTDVCEISGQRTGSRRRREVGRLFDWTITPRQKSSPSVNPFHSCLFFSSSPSLPLSHPPLSSSSNGQTERFVQTSSQSFLLYFFPPPLWHGIS